MKLCDYSESDYRTLMANVHLTDEEGEIVALLRRGWKNIDIAAELGWCERTIERRNKKIYKKIEMAQGYPCAISQP